MPIVLVVVVVVAKMHRHRQHPVAMDMVRHQGVGELSHTQRKCYESHEYPIHGDKFTSYFMQPGDQSGILAHGYSAFLRALPLKFRGCRQG